MSSISRVENKTIHQFFKTTCPKECWQLILSFVSENLRDITSAGLVSQGFLELCLASCESARIQHAFGRAGRIDFETIPQPRSLFSTPRKLKLLAIDDHGRHYLCGDIFYGHILYIMDPAHLDQPIVLDLKAVIEKIELNGTYKNNYAALNQNLVSCEFTVDGFILVTEGGYSLWRFNEGKPEFVRFESPFATHLKDVAENRKMIDSSAYYEGKLLLNSKLSKHFIIDITSEERVFSEPQFESELQSNLEKYWSFFNRKDGLCLYYEQNFDPYVCHIQIKRTQNSKNGEWIVGAVSAPKTPCIERLFSERCPIQSSRWRLGSLVKSEQFTVINNGALWMGKEYHLEKSYFLGESHFILYKDFLFLSYKDGHFRLIYLPTRFEYNLPCRALIQSYLKQKNALLFWISLDRGGPEDYLNLFFKTFGPHDLSDQLHSVRIPLNGKTEPLIKP